MVTILTMSPLSTGPDFVTKLETITVMSAGTVSGGCPLLPGSLVPRASTGRRIWVCTIDKAFETCWSSAPAQMIVLPPLCAPKIHLTTHHCIEITDSKTSTACSRCRCRRGSRCRCCCCCGCSRRGWSKRCCRCRGWSKRCRSCSRCCSSSCRRRCCCSCSSSCRRRCRCRCRSRCRRRNVAVNERGALVLRRGCHRRNC